MGKIDKKRCKLKKDDIKKHLEELKEDVLEAQYICKKCGHASSDKKALCKPEKLKE
ncbi:MAG: hypothetical protein ACLFR1_16260 [Spirochaetia bacterium]